MAIILYDLCARDERIRFSPHCWKIKMALAHKRLAFETRATPFTKIPAIGGGFSKTVPVIDDGGRLVRESFDIAVYLEETYPDGPSLFKGEGGRAEAKFVESWAITDLHPPLFPLIVGDIHAGLDEENQVYFRESREKRSGRTLEDMQSGREGQVIDFREKTLAPLRLTFKRQPFLGGGTPTFADYIVFGAFQWARVVSPFGVLPAAGDPVTDWFERCLDLHGGIGREMPAAAA